MLGKIKDLQKLEEQLSQLVNNNTLVSELKSGGTIHIKPENKGKFTATKKRTGKTTEELAHSKNPLTRKRAQFALNARKWKHQMGGVLLSALFDPESKIQFSLKENDPLVKVSSKKTKTVIEPKKGGNEKMFMNYWYNNRKDIENNYRSDNAISLSNYQMSNAKNFPLMKILPLSKETQGPQFMNLLMPEIDSVPILQVILEKCLKSLKIRQIKKDLYSMKLNKLSNKTIMVKYMLSQKNLSQMNIGKTQKK